MAREYGKVSMSIWRSKRFRSAEMDDQARLFYFYLHTCPHANSVGCFWLPKGYIAVDTKWSDSDINRAIQTCVDSGLIDYDQDEEVVLIERFLEHSPITNKKHAIGAVSLVLALPRSPLKDRILNDLRSDKWAAEVLDEKAQYSTQDSPIEAAIPTETETETNSSASNEAGAKTPTDEEWLLRGGLEILTAGGSTEKQARGLIGKWRKDGFTDAHIRRSLEEARDNGAAEPAAYVTGVLRKPPKRDPTAPAVRRDMTAATDAEWRTRIRKFQSNGFWLNSYGARPGAMSSSIPRHIREEFGL